MELGDKIKFFREKKKISQRELGRRIGKTGQLISLIECGKSSVSLDTLLSIAEELDVSMFDLYVELDDSDIIKENPDFFKEEPDRSIFTRNNDYLILALVEEINGKFLNSKYDIKSLLDPNLNMQHKDSNLYIPPKSNNYINFVSELIQFVNSKLNIYENDLNPNKKETK